MARMTRSSIKQEPMDDAHSSTQQPQPAPDTARYNSANGTHSRPMSVDAAVNAPPAREEEPLPSSGSGDTIMDDGDVEVNGFDRATATVEPENEIEAMHTLGQHARPLIQAVKNVEALGIDASLGPLPKFVVVGNQSAGKSSIIEAVCDISVPRSEGSCTRCPFQITTSASNKWICRVSLTKKYDFNKNAPANDHTKYHFWTEKDLTTFDFQVVRDKSMLEGVLQRAQAAVLNPSRVPTEFLSMPAAGLNVRQVGFSPNIVSLDITGPGLPDLSFFDLPGAINVHESDEDYLVEFVEKLIKNYLCDDKTLVLLACSADQDIENSTAFRFVKDCRAKDRCIGVLTKPDLVEKSRPKHEYIRRVLNNEVFKLGHEWYVTKQLSRDQLQGGPVPYTQARALEKEFFSSLPWNSVPFAPFHDRFGTQSLQAAISYHLVVHIIRELPHVQARVTTKLEENAQALSCFPEKPQSASHEVMDVCDTLGSLVIEQTRPNGSNAEFRTGYKKLIRDLGAQLALLRPHVVVSTPGYERLSISVDSDDETTPAATPMSTPSKKRRLGADIPSRNATPQAQRSSTQTPRSTRVKIEDTNRLAPTKLRLTLEEICELYERGSGSQLPDQINPKVTEQIVKMSITYWPNLVNKFLGEVKKHVFKMLEDSLHQALANRKGTQLFKDCKTVLGELATSLTEKEYDYVHHLVSCETHRPIIYNKTYMTAQTDAARDELQNRRLKERIDEHYDTVEANGGLVPRGNDRQKKGAEMIASKPDQYRREVEAMAQPLAYYGIASTAMLDTIAKHLDYGLLYAIEKDIRGTLRRALNVKDEEHCLTLLAEDPQREAARSRLEAESMKLQQALEMLEDLPQLHGMEA